MFLEISKYIIYCIFFCRTVFSGEWYGSERIVCSHCFRCVGAFLLPNRHIPIVLLRFFFRYVALALIVKTSFIRLRLAENVPWKLPLLETERPPSAKRPIIPAPLSVHEPSGLWIRSSVLVRFRLWKSNPDYKVRRLNNRYKPDWFLIRASSLLYIPICYEGYTGCIDRFLLVVYHYCCNIHLKIVTDFLGCT